MCLVKDGYDLLTRKVRLFGDIEQDGMTATAMAALIVLIDDEEKRPIDLYINSYGGDAITGLALHDLIKRSKCPINGHIMGSCMSAGTVVWLACHNRFMSDNSTLMIHEVANEPGYLKASGHKLNYIEMQRLTDQYINIYKKNTIKDDVDFKELMKIDTFLTKKQVKELGWL